MTKDPKPRTKEAPVPKAIRSRVLACGRAWAIGVLFIGWFCLSFNVSAQSTAGAATDGKVWGALVFASAGTAAPLADGAPKELNDLNERLGKAFSDFSKFEVLGQHTQDIFRQYESWVVPTRELFLKIDSKGPAEGGGMNLGVQFWRGQQVLVKTDVILRHGSPLLIGGPKWRDGRLIFVLHLMQR